MSMPRSRRFIYAVAASIGLLLIVGGLFIRWNSGGEGSVQVKVVVAPSQATLYVDGNETKTTNGTVSLTKGHKHALVAKLHFFSDATVTVDPTTYDVTKTVYLLPSPTTPEAIDWLMSHPDAQREREGAGADRDNQSQSNMHSPQSNVQGLPYDAIDFRVDYSTVGDGRVQYQVTINMPSAVQSGTAEYNKQYKQYKDEADAYLRSRGVDLATADVTYTAQNG